jgi:hypothetical protein
MKTKEEIIKRIKVDNSNLEHICKSGTINGSLLIDIQKAMQEYHDQFNNWISVEESLPMVTVDDFLNNNELSKAILVTNGIDMRLDFVGDHNVWYYVAKEAGITHWMPLPPLSATKAGNH